jgi:uncharacterized protein YuzE
MSIDPMKKHEFRVSVAVDDETGTIEAAYFMFRKGKSAGTKEFANGAALADYDKNGRLLGVELLEPCKVKVFTEIGGEEPEVARFMEDAAPRALVTA